MRNETDGAIFQQPRHIQLPDADAAGQAGYLSFIGKYKTNTREPPKNRPIDPAERYPRFGASWPVQALPPVPVGEKQFQALLSGPWFFSEKPTDEESWREIPVPCEPEALGYDIYKNRDYAYRTSITVPEAWQGRILLLRFGMAYGKVTVLVNGKEAGTHTGSFMTFDFDLTDVVHPGESVCLTLICRDHTFDNRDAAGPGTVGLIDDVYLYALPRRHLTRFFYTTEFDDAYANADLTISAQANTPGELTFQMIDPQGNPVALPQAALILRNDNSLITLSIPVSLPIKWDAEHPNLYCLEAVWSAEGQVEAKYCLNVGFRQVERKGNNLYVNGQETKLRGAALYGNDPLRGRVFSLEQLTRIVQAAKEANINYFRSSAYPERPALYDLCDQYGIYVEECSPVNFSRGLWDSQQDLMRRPASDLPAASGEIMDAWSTMIERDRNHPSIIIWEYANESDWGINFQSELDYAAVHDPTRLTAGTWDNSHTSLASYHYPEYDEIIPNAALYDEYAHVPTHAVMTLRHDPGGIRNAWGLSIQKGWDAIWESEGVVGAAIFAMSDFCVFRPDGQVLHAAYGQWGLLDSWLRKKPEWYLTKKAYSPVRLPEKQAALPAAGLPLTLAVQNRYNHTNLREIAFRWEAKGKAGEISGPDLAPRQSGALILPDLSWQDGDQVRVRVVEPDGHVADEYLLTIGNPMKKAPEKEPLSAAPRAYEKNGKLYIICERASFTFDMSTGLMASGSICEKQLIESRPYLNLYGAYYKPSVFQNDRHGEFGIRPSGWHCDAFSWCVNEHEAIIKLSGFYPGGRHFDMWQYPYSFDPIRVSFRIRIEGNGRITTDFTVHNPPREYIFEAGVFYVLSDKMDTLAWEREAAYSLYPNDHIGRPTGTAKRHRQGKVSAYRQATDWNWSQDDTNYALYPSGDKGGHGTNDFISTRENIRFAEIWEEGTNEKIHVEANETPLAVRTCPSRDEDADLPTGIKLTMNTALYYDLGNGSSAIVKSGDGYMGNYTYPEIHLDTDYHASVVLRLTEGR